MFTSGMTSFCSADCGPLKGFSYRPLKSHADAMTLGAASVRPLFTASPSAWESRCYSRQVHHYPPLDSASVFVALSALSAMMSSGRKSATFTPQWVELLTVLKFWTGQADIEDEYRHDASTKTGKDHYAYVH
jgi:hypothetical protein